MKLFNKKIGTSSMKGFTGVEVITDNNGTVEKFIVKDEVKKEVAIGMLSDADYAYLCNAFNSVQRDLMQTIQEHKRNHSVMFLDGGVRKLVVTEEDNVPVIEAHFLPANNMDYDGGDYYA